MFVVLKKQREAKVYHRPLETGTVILKQLSWISAFIAELFKYDLVLKVKGLLFSWSKYLIRLLYVSKTVGWLIKYLAASLSKFALAVSCTGSKVLLVPVQTGIFKDKWNDVIRHRSTKEDNTRYFHFMEQ